MFWLIGFVQMGKVIPTWWAFNGQHLCKGQRE